MDRRYGYNQTSGGETAICGAELSPEAHERLRKAQIGKRKGSQNGNSRRVRCVDTGIEYASGIEASVATGINKHHIWANARGDRKDAGGMQWEYLDPSKRTGQMPESFRENKRGERNGRARALRCIETGVVYKTGRELAKELGINHSSVSTAMHRNGKIKGLHYEFIDKGELNNEL